MSNLLVIGAGMVGSAMARDLAKNHTVTLADISSEMTAKVGKVDPSIQTMVLDVTDTGRLKQAAGPFDLVVTAVPGFLGFQTVRDLIEAGKNIVDISFFPENALELDELAKRKGVTAIVDCGVAPGMDNLILGHYNEKMKVTEFECLVGGLPKNRVLPFEYKAPFSPIDVIEEYTRPARFVENGKIITKPPLTDIESVDFEGVGELEAFNSDGLRSILYTMGHIPNMKEKTLRYPGHAEKMKLFADSGLFSDEPLRINGKEVRPVDLTSQLLFDHWKLDENEEELTVMKVRIKGSDHEGEHHFSYNLYDEYDKESGISSMARSTGYTATAVVNWLLQGSLLEPGIFPPELIGARPGCLEFVLNYLRERGVVYRKVKF